MRNAQGSWRAHSRVALPPGHENRSGWRIEQSKHVLETANCEPCFLRCPAKAGEIITPVVAVILVIVGPQFGARGNCQDEAFQPWERLYERSKEEDGLSQVLNDVAQNDDLDRIPKRRRQVLGGHAGEDALLQVGGNFNFGQLGALAVEAAFVQIVDKYPTATADIEDAACSE